MVTRDLFKMNSGDEIEKSSLNELIQYSKKPNQRCWSGPENIINNTYQQGINWIGDYSKREIKKLHGIIVKSYRDSKYLNEWINERTYKYYFQERDGKINLQHSANRVLMYKPRPVENCPVLVFEETGEETFKFLGFFKVDKIDLLTSRPSMTLVRLEF